MNHRLKLQTLCASLVLSAFGCANEARPEAKTTTMRA